MCPFFPLFAIFYITNRITNDSYFRSKYLGAPKAKNKHVQLSAVNKCNSCQTAGNSSKPNGLLFLMPTQPRFSFECMITKIISFSIEFPPIHINLQCEIFDFFKA
jgi:hypothetical protein